jgi:cellulose synthase/poly-beta-1,6-N-acetylglucosamine synthase-like glycosyltransferase
VTRAIRAVGVIVPAHNEQDLLPSCLASVRRAVRPLRGLPVHVVVVADACRDRTVQAARRGGASVVTIRARNAGAARAAGAREALRRTGQLDPANVWLVTTDADTLVPARWLHQQTRYADQGWDAIVGTIRVADWSGYPPGTRSVFRERYERDERDDAEADLHPHVHGANLGFRASAYLRAGGFPALPTAEDHALVTALTTAGSRVLRTRALPVVTSARRESRAPLGFSHYLRQLAATPDTARVLAALAAGIVAVAAAELLDSAGGVDHAGLAGVERVARGRDLHVDDGIGVPVFPLDRAVARERRLREEREVR